MAEKASIVGGKKRRHRVEVFAIGPNDTILAASTGFNKLPELPGGGVDEGETNWDAGAREADEESGWVVWKPFQLMLNGDWVFKGSDCPWFNKAGWQEEENIAIICKAIKFGPTEHFGTEGDAQDFQLYPIQQILEETERFSTRDDISNRKRLLAYFRIAVIKELQFMAKENSESAPSWRNW